MTTTFTETVRSVYRTEQLVVNDVSERASVSSSVCEMQENNSERSLNLAHFDTGLVVLTSPAVKCQCCQIITKTLKHLNSLCVIAPKKSYISYPQQTTLLTQSDKTKQHPAEKNNRTLPKTQ